MPTRELRRTLASFPVLQHEYTFSERASHIGRLVNVARTSGAALVIKEAAGNEVEASHIVGAAKVAKTQEAAKIAV